MVCSTQFTLAPDRVAVREARQRVRTFSDLPQELASNAELVVSELVANSVLHAHLGPGDLIEITLWRDDRRLHIEVDDHGGFSGRPRHKGGLGFRVLDALCEDWRAEGGRVSASLRF